MQRRTVSLFLLSALFLGLSVPSHSAEEKSGFFGFKRAAKKAVSSSASSKAGAGSEELTDEEKKMLKEIGEKAPKDAADKESVKLPPSSRLVPPPQVHPPSIPRPQTAPVTNPNNVLIRVPQAPPRGPQSPNALTAPVQAPPSAPVDPTKKKP